MAKSFETKVEINGAIGSSFTEAFRKASSGLVDLRKEARAVQQEMDRLGRDFRQGKIHQSQYTQETQKLTRELNKLEHAQKRQIANQQRMSAIKSNVGGVVNNVKAAAGMAVVGGGAVAAAGIVKSINTAADFEAQLAKVGAKAEATNAEMMALSQTAQKLGASSSLSASEVAIGMDDLAAGGMNANQIIQAMPGLIAGAEASGEDLATVADVVTSAINSYGMEAKEASRVSDIMAMAANKSAADVVDLGHAFKYAAPVANTLGISIEELSAATGILTDKGLAGEQAGTSLRMALMRLSSPPKAAQKALDKLNITAVNSNGKFKSLTEITEEWTKATENLSDTQKVSYASTIFGTEAATAMLSLFDSGPDKINEMTTALEKSGGAANEAAKKMKDNFAGAKEQLFGAVESAQIAFASPILPVLQDTFSGISATIESNLPAIENAGKAVAEVLDDITAPFQVSEKPIKPEITPDMNFREVEEVMSKYEADLAQYELFGNMDFGDKVVYMLDETGSQISGWLDGEGGELVGVVFTELGTIAGEAWLTGFKTTATGAIGEIMDGNLVGGLALATAANAMTGGLLMKGGVGGAKWAGGKVKDTFQNRKSKKAVADTTIATDKPTRSKKSKTNTKTTTDVESTAKATRSAKNASKSGLSKFAKVGKVGGKAFLPLSLLASAADIATSKNKHKAVGGAAGGLGGGLAGAAAGATIGSAVPVIGTAIGGIAGGLLGGLGGDWIGGKIGDWFGKNKASASTVSSNNAAASSLTSNAAAAQIPNLDFSQVQAEMATVTRNMNLLSMYLGQASGMVVGSFMPMQAESALVNTNMNLLSMYLGQSSGWVVGAFMPLQEQSNLVINNLSLLSSYTGQASGWLASLQGIQPAGQRVINALNNLERRINNINLPSSGGDGGRLAYE